MRACVFILILFQSSVAQATIDILEHAASALSTLDPDPWGTNDGKQKNAETQDAKGLFEGIKHIDMKAPFAPAQLLKLGQNHNETNKALVQYQEAASGKDVYFKKFNAPENNKLSDLSQRGQVGQSGGAQNYLMSMLAQGGPTATLENYLMSFLMNEQGFSTEASYFFNKAEFMKQLDIEHAALGFVRPLQFDLPQMYYKLGMPLYSVNQMHPVRFLSDEAFKEERFIVQNEMGSSEKHANFGGYWQYDSNVLGLAKTASLPAANPKQSGTGLLGVLNLGIESSPSQSINFGADLYSFISHHTREDLAPFDTWTSAPSLWVSYWNSTDDEWRLRYDYAYTQKDRTAFHSFNSTHGPQGAWAHLWAHKYQTQIGYSFKLARYPIEAPIPEDKLNGSEHSAFLKVSYPGLSRRFQPFFAYRFSHDWPVGSHFQSNAHEFDLGTAYLVGQHAIVNLTSTYGIRFFPHNDANRIDKPKQMRLLATYDVRELVSLFLDVTYADTDSSVPESFAISRWKILLGPVFKAAF